MPLSLDPSKLQVLVYPDPRLRQRGAEVTQFDGELHALADRMLELMRENKGVGLAAAQVGVPLRVFVMNSGERSAQDAVFVNPEIVDPQGLREDEEGCLSIPDVRVKVRRAAQCRLRAQRLDGSPVELEAEGLVARIWQHETDHLNGVLIIDRMGPTDQIATRRTLRELELAYSDRNRR